MLQKLLRKEQFKKTAEATGDLIGNKIADITTSIGKPKEKEKTNEIEGIYIPPEKRQQVIDDFIDYFKRKFYFLCIQMEFQKITNFLDRTSDNNDLPKFITKNGLKFMINQKEIITQIKKLELKLQC